MMAMIGGYLAMMYLSEEFQIAETSLIASLAVISLLTYMYAVYVRPEYAQLPIERTDEEFLALLKRIHH